MPTANDILVEITLEIGKYILVLLGGLILYVIYNLSKQRKLLQFLGADNDARRTIVYLSSLFIPCGCALDFRGQQRTYQGITIPIEELSISTPLSKALAIDPFENIPPIIRIPLQQKFSFFRKLAVDINASPMKEEDMDFSTQSVITVGSQGYNVVTNYFVDRNISQLQISNNGTAITIVEGRHQGEVIHRPSEKHDIAILEKVVDRDRNNTTIIIGAGLATLGTMGAIHYLIDHWQDLHKTYQDGEFALVLQFGPIDTQPFEEALKGTVVRRLPEK